ncbi:MAG: hypothetical protein LBK99_00110 [Opitutaceae bacterium]|jgi:hypothetical protein|nr:hypothetical protein [Opitutaceae bacterium]
MILFLRLISNSCVHVTSLWLLFSACLFANLPILNGHDKNRILPLPGVWQDNGAWADSPSGLFDHGKEGHVSIKTKGFTQVFTPLPALEKGSIYRFTLDASYIGQIEKVSFQVRKNAAPYNALSEESIIPANGTFDADTQFKSLISTNHGEYGVYLVTTGVGTINIHSLVLEKRNEFLIPHDPIPARGELILNHSFLLGKGGWHVNESAQISGSPPALKLDSGGVATSDTVISLRIGKHYDISVLGKSGTEARMEIYADNGENTHLVRSLRLSSQAVVATGDILRWQDVVTLETPLEGGVLPKSKSAFVRIVGTGVLRQVSMIERDQTSPSFFVTPTPAAHVRFEVNGELKRRLRADRPVDMLVRITGITNGTSITVNILDWAGNIVRQDSSITGPLEDGTNGFRIRNITLPTGWFDTQLHIGTNSEDKIRMLPGEIVILPAETPPPENKNWVLGHHLQYWARNDRPGKSGFKLRPDGLSTLREGFLLGIQSVRTHPPLHTKWWAVEPEEGVWTFADDLTAAPVQAGLSTLGLLDGTARYASSAPAKELESKSPWPKSWGVYPTTNDTVWRNYIRVMVHRYKTQVHSWEIWNEPDHSSFMRINPDAFPDQSREEIYVNLVKSAAEEIRQIDPDITIVAGAVTSSGQDFLLKSIELGLTHYCDAISMHCYSLVNTANRGTAAFTGMIIPVINAMKKHGRIVDLWDSETSTGWIPDGRPGIPNAETELKGILARRALGFKRLYLYNGYNKSHPLHKDFRMLWGFNDRPLPVQSLIATHQHILGDARFVAILGDEARGQHVYLFEGLRGRVVAGWTSASISADFDLPASSTVSGAGGRTLSQTGVDLGVFSGGRLPLVSSVRYFVFRTN